MVYSCFIAQMSEMIPSNTPNHILKNWFHLVFNFIDIKKEYNYDASMYIPLVS